MDVEKLYLEVTRMCNLECEHCLRGNRENSYMSDETIMNALKNIKRIKKIINNRWRTSSCFKTNKNYYSNDKR